MSESKTPRTDAAIEDLHATHNAVAMLHSKNPIEQIKQLTRDLADALAAKERAEEAERSLSEQVKAMDAALADAERDAELFRESLERIQQWARAYPLDIFHEPDLAKAHEVLTANGMTLDAISAHVSRHVISGVSKIVDGALDAAKACPPHRWDRDGEHCEKCGASDWMSGHADAEPPQAEGA